jgi:hypothetical protein
MRLFYGMIFFILILSFVFAFEDINPPVISDLILSSTDLNQGQEFYVTLTATDYSTIDQIEIRFQSDRSEQWIGESINPENCVTDPNCEIIDANKYEIKLKLQENCALGKWTTSFIYARDSLGNSEWNYPSEFFFIVSDSNGSSEEGPIENYWDINTISNLNCVVSDNSKINCDWNDLEFEKYFVVFVDDLEELNEIESPFNTLQNSNITCINHGNCIEKKCNNYTDYSIYGTIVDSNSLFIDFGNNRTSNFYVAFKGVNSGNNFISDWSNIIDINFNNRIFLNDFISVNTLKPDFSWEYSNNHEDVFQYNLQYSLSPKFDINVFTFNGLVGNDFTPQANLPYISEDTNYYWRVKAKLWDGNETNWSKTGIFQINLGKIHLFVPRYNNDKNILIQAKNRCSFGDKAQIQISPTNNFSEIVSDINFNLTKKHHSDELFSEKFFDLNVGFYVIRSRLINNLGEFGEWSETQNFAIVYPLKTKLISPIGRTIIDNNQPTLYWKNTENFNGQYEIRIKKENDFDYNYFYSDKNEFKLPFELKDEEYQWGVNIIDTNNYSSGFVDGYFIISTNRNNIIDNTNYYFFKELIGLQWTTLFLPRIILDDINSLNKDYSIENVLSTLNNNYHLFYRDSNSWKSYIPDRPVNDLIEFVDNENKPYWIKTENNSYIGIK